MVKLTPGESAASTSPFGALPGVAEPATDAAGGDASAKANGRIDPAASAVSASAQPLVALKLAQMVEPFMPDSVRRRMKSNAEVIVDFTVNTDGSVSNVVIQSCPIKTLESHVIEAVKQWRYEPVREAREHSVQLLFRMEE